MNKLLCLSIAGLCLCVNDARAWISWEVGVKHGYNVSRFVGDHLANTTRFKNGVSGGLFMTAHFTDRYAARVEGLYTQKGATDTLELFFGSEAPPVVLDVTVELEYFEIPILGVLSILTRENTIINVFAGPALAIKTNATRKIKAPIEDEQGKEVGEIEEDMGLGKVPLLGACRYSTLNSSEGCVLPRLRVNEADLGIVVGTGVVFEIGRMNFVGDVRWTFGLTKYRSSDTNADVKNSAFSFMMGIAFRLGR